MRDVSSINARQIRIYEPDVIPFRFLRTKIATEYLVKQFQFKETDAEPVEIGFHAGTFALSETNFLPINFVLINERRIIVDVAGSSDAAGRFYEDLRFLLASMDPDHKLQEREPLITTHETQCVSIMEFDWRELFAEGLATFIGGPALRAVEVEGESEARLTTFSLRFGFSFSHKSLKLLDSGVTLSDKYLVIEPRGSTPLEDRRFYSVSPLPSDAHIRLLGQLEQSVLGDSRGKRRKSLPAST